MTSRIKDLPVREHLVSRAIERADRHITQISTQPPLTPNELLALEEDDTQGKIWSFMKERDMFHTSTRFYEGELARLHVIVKPFFVKNRARGPKPVINDLDAIVLYLYWCTTAATEITLGKMFGYGPATITTALRRARDALLELLKSRWWGRRRRPVPLEGHPQFGHIALLCDSTSVEIFRPTGRDGDGVGMWDGKNRMHALKKQVLVMANPPHFCMFTSTARPGSEHDFKIFKATYRSFVPYLAMTDEEKQLFPHDDDGRWAVLGDAGYLGEATPDIRKVAMNKPSSEHIDPYEQQELAGIRSSCERFFGRLQQAFAVFRGVYRYLSPQYHRFEVILTCLRWDHDQLDDDFDLCCLLTNELIKLGRTDDTDGNFPGLLQAARLRSMLDKKAKRKRSRDGHRQNKSKRKKQAAESLSKASEEDSGETESDRHSQ